MVVFMLDLDSEFWMSQADFSCGQYDQALTMLIPGQCWDCLAAWCLPVLTALFLTATGSMSVKGSAALTGQGAVQLTAADAVAANVSTGASAVVDVILRQAPKARVVLLAILPRGDRTVEAPAMRFLQPSRWVPTSLCPFAPCPVCGGSTHASAATASRAM